ncbi:MAG: hypothetical protein M1272_01625, partial [Firmicutes bacterium]|nr:hypothetical protein [Bacillota bacterium]
MTKIPPDIPTILCLEGPWENNEGTKTSVKPLLTLYQGASGTNFRYRYCETGGELRKHLQRRPNHHVPVLYLAFHGWNGTIQVGHDVVELEQLAEWMGPDHYQNSSVHFSACHTLLAKQDARDFVAYTDVAWLTGYRKTVDWVERAAADLLG